tara:strand:- start:6121 stop:6309 length:189 start_codon:yes stop_codon:yes gene_type:complete
MRAPAAFEYRVAAQIAVDHQEYDGDRLFEESRRPMGAEMRGIICKPLLPTVQGPRALAAVSG